MIFLCYTYVLTLLTLLITAFVKVVVICDSQNYVKTFCFIKSQKILKNSKTQIVNYFSFTHVLI